LADLTPNGPVQGDLFPVPEKLYKIGEVMYYTGLSRQIIHNYTQLGLLKEARRTPSGHRLYAEDVFLRVKRIKELKSEGYNLLQIRDILDKEMQEGATGNEGI